MNFDLYYDWNKTFSYDAFINLVIGGRSIGKTYGLRYLNFIDFIKRGFRFCEITRFENEVPAIGANYFDKLMQNEDLVYNGIKYMYKYKNQCLYLAPYTEDTSSAQWQLAGYLVALSQMQKLKKQTFANVRRIVFDEAIIDRELSPYSRYLKNEFLILMNTVSTLLRETPDIETKGRIYLLGNAVDLDNPYFDAFGIKKVPETFGYYWYNNKTVLFNYIEDKYIKQRKKSSMIAKVLAGTKEEQTMFGNVFKHDGEKEFIASKDSESDFRFSLTFKGFTFGIWENVYTHLTYVTDKIPKVTEEWQRLSVTFNDNDKEHTLLEKRQDLFMLDYEYRKKRLRYENSIIQAKFLELIKYIKGYKDA